MSHPVEKVGEGRWWFPREAELPAFALLLCLPRIDCPKLQFSLLLFLLLAFFIRLHTV
ncbi:hypothetical protein M419DRAFT_121158 [Trichoderma reesei RUT C-30]|uniref:Uncharacterized protein n=1 Tax=Hypocrea jecorina (strain ATCC 56765 / BCRC 32924 / NRRL 11460 / Rut C-30) TaxID=1344414 RepID=A0A024RVP6_HYPJR|nr:hypothetical protein M419DRAFT_121158 [Trichoderma reesei RUT C-30]